ncbi:Protein-lysine N-methyltransferase efm4 [Elasticomyces elasticus]|nr:Protein-lysine N-methyltransferase efm4 [Elasticomyces elasticus]
MAAEIGPRTHLEPSELASHTSWDVAYARELTNHATSADDEGTIWFDDSCAEEKVLERLETAADRGVLNKTPKHYQKDDGNDSEVRPSSRILDLGTGNGHMLFSLREEGWMGELIGVDYSQASVELARRIYHTRTETWTFEEQDEGACQNKYSPAADDENKETGLTHPLQPIRFEKWDILTEEPGPWLADGFDAVLDKGTFDAISLSADTDAEGRRICESYRDRVTPLVKTGHLLCITSCNWTEAELRNWFDTPESELKYFDRADYPRFVFGGMTGQSVCTVVFERCGPKGEHVKEHFSFVP